MTNSTPRCSPQHPRYSPQHPRYSLQHPRYSQPLVTKTSTLTRRTRPMYWRARLLPRSSWYSTDTRGVPVTACLLQVKENCPQLLWQPLLEDEAKRSYAYYLRNEDNPGCAALPGSAPLR